MDTSIIVTSRLNSVLGKTVYAAQFEGLQEVVAATCEIMGRKLAADAAYIWLAERDCLHLAFVLDRPPQILTDLRPLDFHDSLAGKILSSKQVVIVDDVRSDARLANPKTLLTQGVLSLIGYPIPSEHTPVGVVIMFGRKTAQFSTKDIRIMSVFCELLGLAIHHCGHSPEVSGLWQSLLQMFANDLAGGAVLRKRRPRRDSRLAGDEPTPKGIDQATMLKVFQILEVSSDRVTAADVSKRVGIAVATARRYLNYLYKTGSAERHVIYGRRGRPAYSYFATVEVPG